MNNAAIKTSDVAAGGSGRNGCKRVYSEKHLDAGNFLTHSYNSETGLPLCKRVKADHLLCDPCSTDENAPPTCPVCAKRDPRFK